MGVSLINTENGMLQIPFGYEREIEVENIKDKFYSYGFKYKPLTFNLTLAKINYEDNDLKWDSDTRQKISKWLFQNEYKPFISLDDTNIIYYCKVVGEIKRYDTGTQEGYITLKMECNSPYAYTPTYLYTYDYNDDTNIIEINNISNVESIFPLIEIDMIDSKQFEIKNISNGGEVFKFTNLELGERIFVDNDNQRIITNLKDVYRLNDFNKNWLKLVKGINKLEIIGKVKIAIRCIYPISK